MSENASEADARERLEEMFQAGLSTLGDGLAEAAVTIFEDIINLGFSNATLLSTYGNALRQSGRFEDAVRVCREAVMLEPKFLGFRINQGAAELAAGRWDEAVGIYLEARALWPDERDVYYNLGTAWLAGRDYESALEVLEKAVEIDPHFAPTWENLGAAKKLMGDAEGYLSAQEEAVRLDPSNAETSWNLGVALLQHEQWVRGWEHYESRLQVDGIPRRILKAPSWDGRFAPGETVLVHAEQGFGDTFQFVRFLQVVRERVGQVVFLCQAPACRGLGMSGLADEVVAHENEVDSYDWLVPLLSLPRILGEQFEPSLSPDSYLVVDPDIADHWAQVCSQLEGVTVGFGWKGNSSYREDYLRSMSADEFMSLLDVPGVHFVSLQKGADEELSSARPDSLTLLGDELDCARGSFVDTAGIVSNVDLVVTTDTALAHLAGGMGADVWLILPAVADWRWGNGGHTSLWYPTMRIFRQSVLGDWAGLIAEVRSALEELSSNQAREHG